MAVVSVKQMWSRRSAGEDESGRKFSAGWTVLMSSPDDTANEARLAPGIPRFGDLYPGDPFAVCREVMAEPAGGPLLYLVTATYRIEVSPTDPNRETGNPLEQPRTISWSWASGSEPVDESIDGKPLVNSVGEPFEGLAEEVNDPVCTITKNERSFSRATYVAYMGSGRHGGAVASDAVQGFAPGCARLMGWQVSNVQVAANLNYWRSTYVLQFRRSWRRRVLNQGFRQIVGYYGDRSRNWWGDLDRLAALWLQQKKYPTLAEATAAAIAVAGQPVYEPGRNADGTPLTKPRLLGLDGRFLKDGQPAVWLEFQMFPELPFAPLGIAD